MTGLILIRHGSEWYRVDGQGRINRPGKWGFSDTWRIIGAVERNNFFKVVHEYSLDEILTDPESIPWLFKNGKQRVWMLDSDHGTTREWRSPTPVYAIKGES